MFLFLIAGVSLFIAFKDIFAALVEVSNKQINQDDENIRVRAMRFFMTDFQPNFLTYLFGNGMSHQASLYGVQVYSYKVFYGFYQTDIGIVGELSIYGAFFVTAGIASVITIIKAKLPVEFRFFRYLMLDLIISLPTGMAFSVAHSVFVLACILYIIDYTKYYKLAELEKSQNE